jgi:hypothetical protein
MVQLITAQQLVTLVINAKSCIYSQWFAGELNVVSDCLSHDFHLSDLELTNLIQSCIPNQTPFAFFLSSLPIRNLFMADLSAAESAIQGGVVQRTNKKQTLT